MELRAIIKGVGKALPVIIAYAPAIADLVRQVKAAFKAPKPEPKAEPVAAGQ
jgi:hypothetical protein